jgi:HlyD family secretion protein
MKKKTIVWLGIIAAAVAGVALLLGGRGKADAKYRTAKADRGMITQTVTASGFLSAVTTVQVGSQVSGIIQSLHADFNSPVKKGQVIAELDPTPFQARLDQSDANLEKARVEMRNAEIGLRRQKKLAQEGLAPQADVDAAQANYDSSRASVQQAEAQVKQARTDLRYARILAPIDGVVVSRAFDVGQTVAASFQAPTLFTIAQDLTKMQVAADVSESDIGRIKVNQPVRFNVDAYPNREFRGEVDQIRLNATVTQNVVTYPVIITVANPDGTLRPNMTANVSIDVATVQDVLRVPNAALRFRPEGVPTPTPMSPPAGAGGQSAARSGSREAPAGGSGAASPARAGLRDGGAGRAQRQIVWLLPAPNGTPRAVEVRTGITDGRYTQIVSGDVSPGAEVIVGTATSRVEASAAVPGMGPVPPGGRARRGF